MVTSKQIQANKKNALKGGVKTSIGREVVSKNAFTHGLTSQRIISQEEKTLYQTVLDKIVEDTKPNGCLEMIMCERIALYQMKLLRLVSIESMFIETSRMQAEIDALRLKQPQAGILDISLLEVGLLSPAQKQVYDMCEEKILLLSSQIRDLQNQYFPLCFFDTLERLQRYESLLESRLLKVMREYFSLKEVKRS